jgi:hypothetical protein
MRNEDDRDVTLASAPASLDRHAVNAAGYLLMAGMWLEQQARGFRRKSRIARHGDPRSARPNPNR